MKYGIKSTSEKGVIKHEYFGKVNMSCGQPVIVKYAKKLDVKTSKAIEILHEKLLKSGLEEITTKIILK